MSPDFSAHISWLFGELPYLQRPAAARAAGLRWIETAWPSPAERERLHEAVAEAGVGVALLNCDAGDVGNGERGYLNDPARRGEAERAFLAAAELAAQLGAPNLNLLVGRHLPGVPRARQRETVLEALRDFAPEAAARGLRILLEPVNAIEHPGFLAPTPQAAAELIRESGADGVGLLLDVYHLARAGDDPLAAIDRHGELIGHVQIADFPGRHQPGTGAVDIAAILSHLGAAGYSGRIGLEYEPLGTTEDSLAFLAPARAPIHP